LWGVTYVGGIVLVEILHTIAGPNARWTDGLMPMVLGCVPSWIVLEWSYRSGRECDWLPDGLPRRLGLYFVSFVVALFVIYPGIALDAGISIVYRIVVAVSLISFVALLLVHLRSHQAEGESGLPASKSLRFVSMLPVLMLSLMVGTILLVGIIELITHPPR
jgi:hypothetical protein